MNGLNIFKAANSPKYFSSIGSLDPNQCIGRALQGEIDVGDTGPTADDAFFLYWDGELIGETEVGVVNHISLGNLRGGDYELRIWPKVVRIGVLHIKKNEPPPMSNTRPLYRK